VYREWIYIVLRTHTLTDASIPFFFEPKFDAKVAPLEAARRIQKDLHLVTEKHHNSKQVPEKVYEPVVYGDFLREKVGHNFANGGGRYN
jgi:isopenicillin N synthase-like dioxygenase